jgi:hypothetical protein
MERWRLRRWLESGEEDGGVQRVFVQVRRNLDRLTGDVGLLVEVCVRLRGEGRMVGRGRLPDGFGRRSR